MSAIHESPKQMFDFAQISADLMGNVSEDVRKFVPGFVHLLNQAWNGGSSLDEAATSMLSKDNQKLLSSLSDKQIVQVEAFSFFFRIRKFPTSAIIGLASLCRYIQIDIYLSRFNNKKKRYYICCSSEAQNPADQSDTTPIRRTRISSPEELDTEKYRSMNVLKIMKRRLYELELQWAFYGMSTPPHIVIEIEDLRQKIINL